MMYTSDGGLSGQGGVQQNILEQGLPEYEHRHQDMSYADLELGLTKRLNVCSGFVYKTPLRDEIAYFSVPWHIEMPPRLLVLDNTYDKLGRPQKVSLARLLDATPLVGGLENGRSYPNLDAIMRTKGPQKILRFDSKTPKLLALMVASRFDFMIEYSYLATYASSHRSLAQGFAFIPIEESPEFAFTYVACDKTPWGREVIKRVNKVILRERAKPSYLALMKSIYQQQEEKDRLEQIYHQHFLPSRE